MLDAVVRWVETQSAKTSFTVSGSQSAAGLLFGFVALFLYIIPPLPMPTAPAVAFLIWTIAACTFAIVSISASVRD